MGFCLPCILRMHYVSILSFRSGLSQRYGKATMCMSAVGLRDTAVSINLSLASIIEYGLS